MQHAERLGHDTRTEDAEPSLGLIESSSIAAGFRIADELVKASPVQLLWARTVSPGHHVSLYAGEVEEVRFAHERALEVAGAHRIDDVRIPNVHPALIDAVRGPRAVEVEEALGVVEVRSVASALLCADAAAKAAAVELVEVRLAMHLGGKGFLVLAGDLADVEDAVAHAVDLARERDAWIHDVVLPRVSPELLAHVLPPTS